MTISGTLENSPPHFSAVELTISADHNDKEQMEKLITIAERGCIVANTLKKSVDLSITLG
jgi:putative redox protein